MREVIASGVTSVEEVSDRCRAATDCGGCWPELERLLADAVSA